MVMIVPCRCIQTVMTVLCRCPKKAVAMNTKRGITWNPAHKYLQMTYIVVSVGQSQENKQLHRHGLLLIFKMFSHQCLGKLVHSSVVEHN